MKLKRPPQAITLDKWIPTTKWCPKCGKKHALGLDEKTYACECGYSEYRDVHSAGNMLVIKDLILSRLDLVPAKYREITLAEFKASAKY